MKLIVGLGNPGKNYENTRHNVGFMILDNIVNGNWHEKFDALYYKDGDVIYLKPMTYMNQSGISVLKTVKFFKISSADILVIHDDMDLSFKTFKLKFDSSSGGHNGIKSIINNLNTQKFSRLKIGISHDKNVDTVDYVLGKFSKEEINYLQNNYDNYNNIVKSFINDGIDKTMNKYNSK